MDTNPIFWKQTETKWKQMETKFASKFFKIDRFVIARQNNEFHKHERLEYLFLNRTDMRRAWRKMPRTTDPFVRMALANFLVQLW